MIGSWHEMALAASTQGLLASPLSKDADDAETLRMADITLLSKGTLTLLACASCSVCSSNSKPGLGIWLHSTAHSGSVSNSNHPSASVRVVRAVNRIRMVLDVPPQRLREWIATNDRPDAIYHITAEAFMAGTPESWYAVALLEALIIEDALYHGQDLINYCVSWLPERLLQGARRRAVLRPRVKWLRICFGIGWLVSLKENIPTYRIVPPSNEVKVT